jgi:hypothetical protein
MPRTLRRGSCLPLPDGSRRLGTEALASRATSPTISMDKLRFLNFDDGLHEYVDNYLEQIRSFCVSTAPPKAEIVFDTKPAFYKATSDSIASQFCSCTPRSNLGGGCRITNRSSPNATCISNSVIDSAHLLAVLML